MRRKTLLRFNYLNHNGEDHNYVIEPIKRFEFGKCNCFPGDPDREAWYITGMNTMRDGELRPDSPMRSFALIKMRDIEELELEDRRRVNQGIQNRSVVLAGSIPVRERKDDE